jgi:cytochrome b561
MRDSGERTQYGSTARALHWLTVLLVVLAWMMARFGEQLFDAGIDALHSATAIGLGVHLWVGLAVLVIVVLRLRWRIANPPPPPEVNEFNRWLISWTDLSARLIHYVLYILLLGLPLTGVLLLFAEGKFLSAIGSVEISPWFGTTRGPVRMLWHLHVILADVFVIVAILHAVTAVLHYAVFRDKMLLRMVPWLRKGNLKPSLSETCARPNEKPSA